MAVKIRPLGDRVLVKPIEEAEVKKGGIIIPDTAKEKPQDGKLVDFTVKKGDKVLISKYGGTEVKLDGASYLIMREDDILGIVG
jgi:chaperonin GroES